MKYLAVTGGTVSGLGKGITISSIGVVLKACGLRVTSVKIDPYLNCDAGTMSPFEHGEVFVLDDGGEGDLDLGNYERFLNITLTKDHNITTGKVYSQVIRQERRGDYLGKTVQVVPHVTDAIQSWIERVAQIPVEGDDKPADVCLIEVGGTVGDIESMVFLEALRQFQFRVGVENFCLVHVSLVPVMGTVGEQKTKPTQHAIKELRSAGLTPDVIICRASSQLEPATKAKIGMFCQVSQNHVLSVHDVSNIYHVPLLLAKQGAASILLSKLQMMHKFAEPDLAAWSAMAHRVDNYDKLVKIALVGKYTGLQDSYLSVIKALKHASMRCNHDLEIEWIESVDLDMVSKVSEPEKYAAAWAKLKSCQGIVVPGGFGDRGVDGKVVTAQYAREKKIPYLGICLGFQVATIEYARNVLGWKNANSGEFDEFTDKKVVVFMPEINPNEMGGTMRCGARSTVLETPKSGKRSLASYLYQNKPEILERHRHRYEINPDFVADLEGAGLQYVGRGDKGLRMQIAELDRDVHPFYFGTQYHPEFKTHPNDPSPPFYGLLLAATGGLDAYMKECDQRFAA
ncbi:CTP synthase [Saprolegnia parasitica CBS 223.65]|uniref:CTP synthase n=1 Tax=Saprolegnia parasitica (strain CBS 223.65) TaxID=695850 RepID=A0A067D115_SAPPC|nr:CTP synthase [Saprolegnia parasitica CBS 223.65]KDO32702.1 CTP synthase [Saprolegnia parasitica CBS 223.65]|eukprot:XP_012196368.1 CTP synthase [Saprolegnia parasitica CBS 223.65]